MRTSKLIYLLLTVVIAGCSAAPEHQAATTGAPHAECLVCKANADLACVDIAVDRDTPSATHDGKTYYFCSDECRGKFAKNPAKYVAKP